MVSVHCQFTKNFLNISCLAPWLYPLVLLAHSCNRDFSSLPSLKLLVYWHLLSPFIRFSLLLLPSFVACFVSLNMTCVFQTHSNDYTKLSVSLSFLVPGLENFWSNHIPLFYIYTWPAHEYFREKNHTRGLLSPTVNLLLSTSVIFSNGSIPLTFFKTPFCNSQQRFLIFLMS